MDDIDFSLPVDELGEYAWMNAVGRRAPQATGEGPGRVSFSALVSLRRNRTGDAIPAM
jgi:hypothetical protein